MIFLDGRFFNIENDRMGSAIALEPTSIPCWPATSIRLVFFYFLPPLLPVGAHAADVPDWGTQKEPAWTHDFRGWCETLWIGTLSNMPRGTKYKKSTQSP